MALAENFNKILAFTPKMAPDKAGGALRWLLDAAVDGYGKVPGAKMAALKHLKKTQNHEQAIRNLVLQHVGMAGAQGFVTNLGGLFTALIAIPANIAGVALVQCRMIAAIAHLRGYNVDDNRVRSAILMCMLGEGRVKELISAGELPSTPLVIATAPVFDAELDQKISKFVMGEVTTAATGKRVGVMVTKRVPIVGGGVGLAYDSWTTKGVAQYARQQFPNRRKVLAE